MAESAAYSRRGHSGAAKDTTLASGINASATSFAATDLSTWTTVTSNGPGRATLSDGTNEEEIEFTGISTHTFTGVTRGVGGTAAQEWDAGASIYHGSSVRDFDEANYAVSETVGKITAADRFLVSDAANSLAEKTASEVRTVLSLTDEHIQDIVGAMVTGNTETGISVTYDDAGGKFNFAVTAAVGDLLDWQLVAKTLDESVTSSTTLQDDNELTFSVGASQSWEFEFVLFLLGSTSGDFKHTFSGPTSPTSVFWGAHGVFTSGTTVGDLYAQARNVMNDGAALVKGVDSDPQMLIIRGVIFNGSNAGSVTLRWAQNASDGTATIVKAGSYAVFRRFA